MATLSASEQKKILELQAAKNTAKVQPANTTYNPTGEINSLYDTQKQGQIAQLEAARNRSISSLNAEKATIQPQYYQQRNNAATASQIGAKNFSEYMAARGGSTGASAQAEISRQSALQGTIGGLRKQEQSAYDDIARRMSDVEFDYQTGLTSANSTSDMARLQALIEARQRESDMNYQREQDAKNLALQEAGLTGTYNGQNTLDREKYLSDLELAQKQLELQRAKAASGGGSSANDVAYERALTRWKTSGYVQPGDADILGVPAGTPISGLIDGGGNTPKQTFTPSQLVSQIKSMSTVDEGMGSAVYVKENAYRLLKEYASSGVYSDQEVGDMARALGLSNYTPQSSLASRAIYAPR